MNSKNPAVKSAIILFILPLTLMLITACAYAYQAGSAEGPSGLPMPKPEISLQDIIRILPEEDETGPAREDIPDDVFCLADEMAQETPSCGTDEVLSGGQAENPAFAADPEMMEEAIMDDLMTDLSGEEIRLGDLILRNQVTMLNVWGISCGPCLLEIPNLVRLREQYKDRGFEIIGLASDLLDPDGETDPDLLEEAIVDRIRITGKKPKAIVPVALYGMPYRIDRIMEIADRYSIPVVEDAAEGFGSRWEGRILGTFGKFGVLSFNGNKMITTSGGGALICDDQEARRRIMWLATQAREAYPYYQHETVGYNYRMSNICAGIGRGQMTIADEHIRHHKKLSRLYSELFNGVDGISFHANPDGRFDSNFWLNTITLDPVLHIKGEEMVYKSVIESAVGGASGVIHHVENPETDCQPNNNVEALRIGLDAVNVESRPLWKPMHKQPVYKASPAYLNGVSEDLFKKGMCLPSGPYVSEEDVRFIVDAIKELIV